MKKSLPRGNPALPHHLACTHFGCWLVAHLQVLVVAVAAAVAADGAAGGDAGDASLEHGFASLS